MLTWREIWYYICLLLRWWWLLLIAVTLPAGIAFLRTQSQPDYYVARTTLQVGDHFKRTDFSSQAVKLSNDLAAYYREMASRQGILEPVSQRFANDKLSWGQIRRMLKINLNTSANLIEISVTDSNPDRAPLLANAVAEEIIAFSPTLSQTIRTDLENQMRLSAERRDQFGQQVEELQTRSATLDSAYDRAILNEQIAALENEYAKAQSDYLQYLTMLNSSSSNKLTIIEDATASGASRVPTKHSVTLLMAALGGLMVAIVGILLLDQLDDRWRDARELRDRLGVLHLGTIPGSQPMLISPPPLATRREQAMRQAYTRILLEAIEHSHHTLLITSPKPSKARSAFTVDLAELFARAGHRVLLVDADTFMDTDVTTSYLASLVSDDSDDEATVSAEHVMVLTDSNVKKRTYLKPTPLENVMLLGRHIGPDEGPPMPMVPWAELLKGLNQCADVIIFDGPSALNGADAALLAPLVDGVVLTLDPGRDARSEVAESKFRLLRRPETALLGGVIVSHKGGGSQVRNGNGRPRPSRRSGAAPALREEQDHQPATGVLQIAPVHEDEVIETEQPAPPRGSRPAPPPQVDPATRPDADA